MNKRLKMFTLTLVALTLSTFVSSAFAQAQDYAIGADLSFLKQAEEEGFVFKENGKAKPAMLILKDHGYNWVRLRLFHTPTDLPNNLDYTIALAKEAKKHGFKFLLNYHYSDTWADPHEQLIPKAWERKTHPELIQAVYEYTIETMNAFRDSNVFPDMVQIGNEISHGLLWPDGRLPQNWNNFADLIKAGINGVYASCGAYPCPRIMIHIDRGANKNFSKYFFGKLNTYRIPYDVIGLSYYPWWHGSLQGLRECMNFNAVTYKKDIIVVEAAYNWKPAEYIGKKNAPFQESPEGQRQFLEEVNRLIMNVPENRGIGIFWWEPAVARAGSRSFFDEDGEALPVITVFDKFTGK